MKYDIINNLASPQTSTGSSVRHSNIYDYFNFWRRSLPTYRFVCLSIRPFIRLFQLAFERLNTIQYDTIQDKTDTDTDTDTDTNTDTNTDTDTNT